MIQIYRFEKQYEFYIVYTVSFEFNFQALLMMIHYFDLQRDSFSSFSISVYISVKGFILNVLNLTFE